MTKARFKKLTVTIAVLLFFTVIAHIFFTSGGGSYASAASVSTETVSTNAIEDLSKDGTFGAGFYPEIKGSGKLSVMQVAENSKGGLFIYVYQPGGQAENLRATTIRLSRTKGGSWDDYPLTYINSDGVFFKYEVKDFKVITADTERYYDITAIHRKYDKKYDGESAAGTTTDEKAFEVAQCWKATTNADGSVSYEMEQTDVAIIRSGEMNPGFRRIANGGVNWAKYEKCDAHFVAFNCDKKIDELFEADITFVTQDYRETLTSSNYYEPVPQSKTIKADQTAYNKPYGAFGQQYKWERIQKIDDFLKDSISSFSDEERSELKKYTWVLNFYETEYSGFNGVTAAGVAMTSAGLWWASIPLLLGTNVEGTFVSEVSILRLNFQTAGKVYNLGVVSDKVTGPREPIGGEPSYDFWDWLADFLGVSRLAAKLIFSAVVIVAILIVLGILCAIFPPLKIPVRIILAIAFLPFTILYYLLRELFRSRERKRIKKKQAAREQKDAEKARKQAEREAAKQLKKAARRKK
ncbi:MAG: hypothetical protein NC311_18830 [Muribaculaceae bacterium]|nr:hypothetical protein [Muribaculaceae bacterium]